MYEINKMMRTGKLQDVLDLIINHEIDINISDNANQSILFYALKDANIKIIKYLILHGANIHQEAHGYYNLPFGHTPFITFIENIEMYSEYDVADIFILFIKHMGINQSYKYRAIKHLFKADNIKDAICNIKSIIQD